MTGSVHAVAVRGASALGARYVNWGVAVCRLADVRSSVLSMHFVVEFRKRLQFLFCSAEGNVRAINWRTFWLSLLTNAFMPIAMAQMLYRRSVDMGFDLYYLVYYAVRSTFANPVAHRLSSLADLHRLVLHTGLPSCGLCVSTSSTALSALRCSKCFTRWSLSSWRVWRWLCIVATTT